jgi:beta-galactosidase GanA
MLSGELHNSSASNAAYMEPIWDKLAGMHLNTVIATVSWELFEPVEGKFDYSLVDGIINSAKEHQLKLVLIWFGTWKNSWSTYAPEWVKSDLKRFPRMQIKFVGFWQNTMKADISAFTALMKHIKEIDENEQTVIMMQVENETGVLNTSRDHSIIAETKFKSQVSEDLIKYLKLNKNSLIPQMKTILASTNKLNGTWEEVFGQSADEVFQAWYTATYVGKVAVSSND